MQIVVLADALQKEELLNGATASNVIWVEDAQDFLQHKEADAFIDLKFIDEEAHKSILQQLLPKLVVVNSVVDTLSELAQPFVRINGWRTFLSSAIIEAATADEEAKQKTETVFAVFSRKIEWLSDDPGFITPRVVSMIINEAFISLSESVSTKEEINTAMKLGTAYPYGPFEWAEKIGEQNIVTLLQKLSASQSRYTPAELLVQEAGKVI
ncbi:MAG TPA: 3-hydroxyacyl-CoA dehydrogenase family protein [Flavisolibacter sp.]|nr:3-hydroxyacyl-CoA dehydrogenase family protein [Flavisolibacter sp.]